jgi:putative ABC transport system permease protein
MAIVGILGCSALLICAFGLQDTMDHIVTWNYEVINHYETQLDIQNTITEEQLDRILQEIDGESAYEGKVELRVNGKKSGEIMVLEEKLSLIQFVDDKRKIISLPKDELSISYKMAENLGVKVGDEISYLYTVIGTILLSAAVNRLFSKRVKSIDMVSSLKGVE